LEATLKCEKDKTVLIDYQGKEIEVQIIKNQPLVVHLKSFTN